MSRSAMLLLAVVLLVAGCSGDDTEARTTTPTPTTVASGTVDGGTSSTVGGDAAPSSSTTTTAPTTTTTTAGEPAFFGAFETVISASAQGEGTRPLLMWDDVDGGELYAVYVYAPDGSAYWAWQGFETEVHVGGTTQLREDAPGPRVSDGMSWAVVAYDADLIPIAASPLYAFDG